MLEKMNVEKKKAKASKPAHLPSDNPTSPNNLRTRHVRQSKRDTPSEMEQAS